MSDLFHDAKVGVRFSGLVFESPILIHCKSTDIGALIALGQFLMTTGKNSILRNEIEDVLSRRGERDPLSVLKRLHNVGAIKKNDDGTLVIIPLFSEAIASVELEMRIKKRSRKSVQNLVIDGEMLIHSLDDIGFEDTSIFATLPLQNNVLGKVTVGYVVSQQQKYPRIDVGQEVTLAANWCRENREGKTKGKKSPTNARAFLNNWLMRKVKDLEIRDAILRGSSAKNGFGQGTVTELEKRIETTDDNFGFHSFAASEELNYQLQPSLTHVQDSRVKRSMRK